MKPNIQWSNWILDFWIEQLVSNDQIGSKITVILTNIILQL